MRRIRNEPSPARVHKQIELFEHGLPDQDLITEHQGFLESVSSLNLDDEGLGHVDRFGPSVGELRHALTSNPEAEVSGDPGRHDRADCAGIDERIRLTGPDLCRAQHAPSRQSLVYCVRQPDRHTNFAHA